MIQEIRETIAAFSLITGVVALFLFVSIFSGMVLIQDHILDMYLLDMLIIDTSVVVLSFSFLAILSDKVWNPTQTKKP